MHKPNACRLVHAGGKRAEAFAKTNDRGHLSKKGFRAEIAGHRIVVVRKPGDFARRRKVGSGPWFFVNIVRLSYSGSTQAWGACSSGSIPGSLTMFVKNCSSGSTQPSFFTKKASRPSCHPQGGSRRHAAAHKAPSVRFMPGGMKKSSISSR